MCAPTKQNAGFWLKSSKSHQVLHILLYGQAQLLFFSHWRGTLFAWRILYACTHGEVICKATSIFRHKFVWLYPRRGHLQSDQHFPSPICMTVPMARSFWLLATLHHFDFFSGFCILWFARFWPIYKNTHFYWRKALGCVKTLIFIDENKCQLKSPK